MATLIVPYSFIDATAIVASEMNINFGAVKTFVEELAAGTNIDTGAITSDKLSAATVQLLAPTGSVTQFAGATIPTGWLLCDGSAVSRSTYSALFALIGTSFGAGDGTTTFNLPDLKGRVPVGRNASDTDFDTLGETGGAKTHTLTEAQLPSHRHNVPAYTHSVSQNNALGDHSHTFSGSVGGGDHTHGINISDPGHLHSYSLDGITGTATSHAHQRTSYLMAGSNQQNYSDLYASGAINYATTGISASSNNATHGHSYSGTTSNTNLAHGHSVGVGNHAAQLTDPTGSGSAHNNLQPYIVLNYIIKA